MYNFVQFLRTKYSQVSNNSGAKGTITDGLAIQPTGLILADFYNALVSQQSLSDISKWQSWTDDQMDIYGNKFFMPRVQGNTSSGYMRIFVNSKQDMDVASTITAVSDTGLTYQPIMPTMVSRNSFTLSTDRNAKYYVDIPIIATAAGDNYNLNPDQITSLNNASFTYIKVTNPTPITGGQVRETNAQYFQRLQYAINDRSLMNQRSVFANLKQYFPQVNSVYVAGAGSKYMTRDLVAALDTSIPLQKSSFLGKIPGNNTVNNTAYYGTYPPEVGSNAASPFGPFSIYSQYKFPATIEPVNAASTEVGLHGYPLDQEATSEMYNGLYFNDYKNYMTVKTSDLFNILDEGLTLNPVTSPNSNWVIGANGRQNGDYGTMPATVGALDIVQFVNNQIVLSAGASGVITASKDIQKRTGVKLSGSFITPNAINNSAFSLGTNLQFMLAGVNDTSVDSFTGIGFGIRINTVPDVDPSPSITNAVVYFAHSERYASGQVFASTDDFIPSGGFVSISNMNALAEKSTRLTPGSEYNFEFCLNDDLSLSLYLKKTLPTVNDPDDIFGSWRLPSTLLQIFSSEINKADSSHYGTTMKVTLDTQSSDNSDKWTINNLKAFDIAQHTANALYIFDVQNIEAPLSLSLLGSGSGSINKFLGSGYSAYIWDTTQESPAGGNSSLSIGGWTYLDAVSNPSGLKDSITAPLVQNLSNIDQYVVTSRYGRSLIFLVSATGSSEAKIKAAGDLLDDIYSELNIDYIQIESELTDLYHANNKADLYICSLQNSENTESSTLILEKGSNESLFTINANNGFNMPIEQIKSISSNIGGTITTLASDAYQIIRTDYTNLNSINETMYIAVSNNFVNPIIVEYTSYNSIGDIQTFYNNSQYQKVYGDVLVKHKLPCYLDISILYTGNSTPNVVTDAIKTYTDSNNDNLFSTADLISYLYNQNVVNNVQVPLTISYSRYDSNFNVVTGSFTDFLSITDIEFFRINNISASKL